ncbi:MAG: hypothetical protein OHK0057_35080 [Thermoflexibacter sp.]
MCRWRVRRIRRSATVAVQWQGEADRTWAAPLRFIDPTGRDVTETEWGTSYAGVDAQNMFRQLQQ